MPILSTPPEDEVIDHIVTVEDVTDYMKLSFVAGSASATAASAIIEGLEGDLEAYLRRPLVEADVVDEVAKVDRSGRIRVYRTPVVSVAVVKVDGSVVPTTDYTPKDWGITDLFATSVSMTPPVVLVSYRGGLPGLDRTSAFGKKARATLLRAAARDVNQVVLEQAAGVSRMSTEGTSIEFHGGVRAGAGGLTEPELKQFERWKRRIMR